MPIGGTHLIVFQHGYQGSSYDLRLFRDMIAFLFRSGSEDTQRERVRRWGERSLDVDILLYGQQQIDEPALIVPHAGLHERNFMLVPLRELAPELMIKGQPLSAHPLSADWSGLKLIE